MARTLKAPRNGVGHNSGTPEKPYFDRLVDLERQMESLREDKKQVCIEAKEADIRIQPLKRAVKLYLETEAERTAREEIESEADGILRAIGAFANTPLGGAAVQAAAEAGSA